MFIDSGLSPVPPGPYRFFSLFLALLFTILQAPDNVRPTIRAPHRFSAVTAQLQTCAFLGECSDTALGPPPA